MGNPQIISQEFSHRVRILSPHQPPSLGFRCWEEKPSEHLALRPVGLDWKSSTGLGEQRLHSWSMHTRSHVYQEQEQWLHRRLGQTYLLVLECCRNRVSFHGPGVSSCLTLRNSLRHICRQSKRLNWEEAPGWIARGLGNPGGLLCQSWVLWWWH